MRSLPSGIVTFLLTDIEGSARMFELDPHMGLAVARHEELIDAAAESHGGLRIKTHGAGDSCFLVFERPIAGVLAAADIQRAMGAEPWSTAAPIRVRIGVHTGEAEPRDRDYYGRVVNRASRMADIGHGEQVLVSAATQSLAADFLPGHLTLRHLGPQTLKDLERAMVVYQLCGPGLRDEFPPPRGPSGQRNNLPTQLTHFVGRSSEMGQIEKLLERARLVTVVGPGGCGKTRLAVQVAAEIVDRYADGVWFVDLSTLEDGQLVASAVATELSVREVPGAELIESLVAHFGALNTVLVFDNCEQVADDVAVLCERLLRRCAGLSVLATSRRPLEILGEEILDLHPLPLPDIEARDVVTTGQSDAVQLFEDRARAVHREFDLNESNAWEVAELCRTLDGLPLAIELVAPHVRVMSVEALGERLRSHLPLPTRESYGTPDRQKSIEKTIDWSVNLLGDDERTLFNTLAVMAGSFDRDAVAAVAGFDDAESFEVVDALGELMANCLVARSAVDSDRYRMLETMRGYGREHLARSGELGSIRRRHSEHFAELAVRLDDGLRAGKDEKSWLDAFEVDHGNFRAAIGFADDETDPELGLRLCTSLAWFWRVRGYFSEGRQHLGKLLSAASELGPSDLTLKAYTAVGVLAFSQNDFLEAKRWMETTLEIARSIDNRAAEGKMLCNLGNIARIEGDCERARSLISESLEILEAPDIDEHVNTAAMWLNLGLIDYAACDYSAARTSLLRALEAADDAGDTQTKSSALHDLGSLEAVQGKLAEAKRLQDQSLELRRLLGYKEGIAACESALAAIECERGDYEAACRHQGEALEIAEELGSRWGASEARFGLGEISLRVGDLDAAESHYRDSLRDREKMDQKLGQVRCLCGLTMAAAVRAQWDEAESRLGLAQELASDIDDRRGLADCFDLGGTVALGQGRLEQARESLRQGLSLRWRLKHRTHALWSLDHVSRLAVVENRPTLALRLMSATDRSRYELGVRRPPITVEGYEEALRDARAALTPEEADAAWQAGQSLSLDEAVALALGESES